jgi:hypothetical protein
MPEKKFTPIAAAVRTITSEEASGLQQFLSSSKSLDDFVKDKGLDRATVDGALKETGITLPERGLGNKFTGDELKLYTDVLQQGQNVFSAAQNFGFDPKVAVQGLEESGLRVPLSKGGRELFDTASSLGLSSKQTADQLGLDHDGLSLALRGAGLSLPEAKAPKAPTQAVSNGGPGGKSFLDNIFSRIPNAPGAKLGFNRKKENDRIRSGPRGVETSAAVRVNSLHAGAAA